MCDYKLLSPALAILGAVFFALASCPSRPESVGKPRLTRPTPRRAAPPKPTSAVARFWRLAARLKDGTVDLQKTMGSTGVSVHALCRGPAELKIVSPRKDDGGVLRDVRRTPTLVALLRSGGDTTHCSWLKVRSCALMLTAGAKPRPVVVPLPLPRLLEEVNGRWVQSPGGKLVLQVSSTGPACDDPDDEDLRVQNATLALLRYQRSRIGTLLRKHLQYRTTYDSNSVPSAHLRIYWISSAMQSSKPRARPASDPDVDPDLDETSRIAAEDEKTGPKDLLMTVWAERLKQVNGTDWSIKRRFYRLAADGSAIKQVPKNKVGAILKHPKFEGVRTKKELIKLLEVDADGD